jgi:hypothetical protein
VPAVSAAGSSNVSSSRIQLEPLAGAPAWQAARYEAFSRVKPYADHEAPARVSGLAATAGAGNSIRLSWEPAFDRTEVRYEVYGSRDADFALGPETRSRGR